MHQRLALSGFICGHVVRGEVSQLVVFFARNIEVGSFFPSRLKLPPHVNPSTSHETPIDPCLPSHLAVNSSNVSSAWASRRAIVVLKLLTAAERAAVMGAAATGRARSMTEEPRAAVRRRAAECMAKKKGGSQDLLEWRGGWCCAGCFAISSETVFRSSLGVVAPTPERFVGLGVE